MKSALEQFSNVVVEANSAVTEASSNDIDECLDLADKAVEALEHAVDLMKKLAKRVRKVDSRIAGNLEQYAIGNCEAWLEDESKGGGNTLPEIRTELEEMLDEADAKDED